MTTEQKIIKNKVHLLELARQFGNVSQECKIVETHRSHMMQKLGISNIASLAKFVIRNGLTSLW
jgi:hypothetical protein